ncbi:uncharacterized protein [Leptinotarsa decemlineata]|uniref:uncharacterized protein n=1 Tax=Leptinotarsa decemlineata TaxID=7539 RepID=UPI003D3078CE
MKIYWLICFILGSFFACVGQSGVIFNKLKNSTISLVGEVKSGLHDIKCNAHKIGNEIFGPLMEPCPEDNKQNNLTGNDDEDQGQTEGPHHTQADNVKIKKSSNDFRKSETGQIFFEINSKPIALDKGTK